MILSNIQINPRIPSMDLGQAIKTLRKQRRWTQQEVADRVGTDTGNISRIERGQNVTMSILERLASVFGIKPSEILKLSEDSDCVMEANAAYLAQDIRQVPLISWVQAGAFCEAVDNFQPGDAEEWLSCPQNVGKQAYALKVSGDSMTSPYPAGRSYPEGTVIFVDPDKEYASGSKVIAKLPGTNEVTFKTYMVDAGRSFLKPINPQYPSIEINEEIHICGVVVGSYWPE